MAEPPAVRLWLTGRDGTFGGLRPARSGEVGSDEGSGGEAAAEGLAAITELCGRLGVIGALDAAVGPIKQRDRGFGAGQLLTGIAAAQLAGEDFLAGWTASEPMRQASRSRRCRGWRSLGAAAARGQLPVSHRRPAGHGEGLITIMDLIRSDHELAARSPARIGGPDIMTDYEHVPCPACHGRGHIPVEEAAKIAGVSIEEARRAGREAETREAAELERRVAEAAARLTSLEGT